MSSPTSRSLALLRQSGYLAQVVERFIAAVQRKHDFGGFADIIAYRRGEPGCLAIQTTTRAHVRDRLERCRRRPELATWLASGNRFEVWGWYRSPGGRWEVMRVAIQADDLRAVTLSSPTPRRKRRGERQGFLFR